MASSVEGSRRRQISTPSSVAFGTPASMRYSVVGGQGGADSDLMSTTSSPGGVGPQTGGDAVIWGTDVNVNESWKRFEYFLINFKDPNSTDSDAHYLRKLSELRRTGGRNLNVDMQHLRSFSRTRDFARHVKMYPQEMVPLMDMIVNQVYDTYIVNRDSVLGEDVEEEKKRDDDEDEEQSSRRIMVRPCNLHVSTKMRDLDPKDIDQLVSIRGMIIRSSNIIPDLKHAFFRCSICQNETDVSVDRGRIDEPQECTRCNGKHTFEMVHNRCLYTNKQMIKLQETPESIPEGETPHTIQMFAFDELCEISRPGDKVEVTGIFRAIPLKVNPRLSSLRSVYKTYIDILHISKSRKDRPGQVSAEDAAAREDSEWATTFDESTETSVLMDVRKQRVEKMGRDPHIYENLSASLAPSVWEMDDVKKGLLCQLFGGSHKVLPTGVKSRGEINVLLCGDPGTSKSQLLGYVHKIAPRGIYTSGKGSSAVGLTAYIMKDPDTKGVVLESGALVLSDRGICCIDEFDKMSDTTRSVLHEVMEQQTISIAKAGIICTLNARTSILASANPIDSRYNPSLSVVQNLKLPPTLLSRFDLLYLILDVPAEHSDRRLAKHLVSLYYKDPTSTRAPPPYTPKQVAEYISYCRQHLNPKLSQEAGDALVAGYKDLRNMGNGSGKKVVSATPRQLESLIRLSESLAKIRFSQTVEQRDVKEAIRLMNVATQRAATDPRTGLISMDAITTGQSASDREEMKKLEDALKEYIEDLSDGGAKGTKIRLQQLALKLSESSDIPVPDSEISKALSNIAQESSGLYRYIPGRMELVIRG